MAASDETIRTFIWEIEILDPMGTTRSVRVEPQHGDWVRIEEGGVWIDHSVELDRTGTAGERLQREFFPADMIATARQYAHDLPAERGPDGELVVAGTLEDADRTDR